MGIRNILIEGVSCAGKTTVCDELIKRGFHGVHGDRVLAYQGDPRTGEALPGQLHEHHIWDVAKVRALVAERRHPLTFFCGGCRNHSQFIDLFDSVFVLRIDLATLNRRLAARPDDEWGVPAAIGAANARRQLADGDELPAGATSVDETAPIERVVDAILGHLRTV